MLCAGFGSAGTAVAVALDMTTGVIDRFRTLPISAAAVLTGHVAASVARNVVSTLLVLGVALLAGFRPIADPLNWLAAAGLLLALMTAISWLAACFGLLATQRRGRQRDHVRRRLRARTSPARSSPPTRCPPACAGSPSTSP